MYASNAEQQRREQVQALAERLYRERYHHLLRIAVRNAANEADAEEALHDAFVSFIGHFDPNGESPPLAWLTLTLKRRCWAAYQRRRFEQQMLRGHDTDPSNTSHEPCTTINPFHLLAGREETRTALARVKPAERRALSLLALGYSYREICQQTGWTNTKTRRCIYEGRAALRATANLR